MHFLHGYSDASDLAYACVIYLRSLDKNGGLERRLVTTAVTNTVPRTSQHWYTFKTYLYSESIIDQLSQTQYHKVLFLD